MTYRKPSREEKTLINRALDRWGAFEFFKGRQLMVQEGGKKTVCLLAGALEGLAEMQPFAMGLAIG